MDMTIKDILSLVSPLVVIIATMVASIRWVWHRIDTKFNEGRALTFNRLDRIEGRLAELVHCWGTHDRQIAKLEGAVFQLEQDRQGGSDEGHP